MNATVIDGFKFGCGFILAQIVFMMVVAIIMGLITLVAGGIISAFINTLNLGMLVVALA